MNILIASVWGGCMVILLVVVCSVLRLSLRYIKRIIRQSVYEYYLRRERLEALKLFARDLKELERTQLQSKDASIE
ncbi:hypothetical protein CNO13_07775 (plasmid) [Borrelia miyamotoi]|uniref:Uncharacterized protein n=3 Tax=Borrelia miyamotoi TaxID=47466 RepID=A0A481YG66_9SPIR|nr:hypothetical protein [Borrelia miyamotoi]AHH05512.1 hypothetical protein BOM_0969 [Borrelia miyamotoi FR64b]ATQ20440.1 hypothetical protein CNO10_06610 [Borrelia miyamotoi]QBK65295.1 hypothetical protein EZU69_06400 [Borrelia miyamotoi]QDA32761.1 hypothetical protein CNO09_06935 [Borrelia miyamotoi]WCB91169.1 hypothetical protein CNO11_07888 [Borrelia miyamotoi]